ncbi:MAG TPA: hypothetical protein VHS96_06325 [Bacteroidia bacterium]|nr:hypothetical protein [Bacteroidia bacterium]
MNAIEILLLILLVYVPVRGFHHRYVSQKLACQLGALRDQLRYEAATGVISPSSPGFLTLDHAFSATIQDIETKSAWSIRAVLEPQRRLHLQAGAHPKAVLREISTHAALRGFNKSFTLILVQQLLERHLFVIVLFSALSLVPLKAASSLKGRIHQWMLDKAMGRGMAVHGCI